MSFRDMSFADINKLNYRGSGVLIMPKILKQFMSTEDQIKFDEDYIDSIKKILSSCAGVDKMLTEYIDLMRKKECIDILPSYDTSSCFIHYESIIITILIYICAGKNSNIIPNEIEYDGEYDAEKRKDVVRDFARDYIKKIRKQLVEIKENGRYDIRQIHKDYPSIISMANYNIDSDKLIGEHVVEIDTVVDEAIQCLTQLIFANKTMYDATLKNTLELEKYNIDKDKYLFYVFSTYLTGITNWDDGKVDKNIYPVLSYFKETVDTDTSKLFFYDHKNKKYTFKDFIEKLQEYVKKHKEVNCDVLPFDYFEGWDSEEVNEFLDIFTEETLSNFKEIDPEVLFLPNSKGESLPKEKGTPTEVKEKVFSLLPLEKREFYSKNRDKIHMSLLGEKKFILYILNVLNNGYIIFEKYDTKEGDISSKNAAAYIMNIFNFKSLYTMNIKEIREFIKSQDKSKPLFDRVDYKCHMGNWQEYLQKFFDEDTGINTNDIDEVLALEKVKTVQYKKEKEDE